MEPGDWGGSAHWAREEGGLTESDGHGGGKRRTDLKSILKMELTEPADGLGVK